jgi:arylsulfatase A-like enzyme
MPNVLIIMTDNQGAWTLGCHGNDEIRTPHIDRLAAEGVRFARAYAVNSVCSPSRATFFTGLLPSQHGVHCYLGGERPDAQMGPDAYCTIREFVTLPRLLRDAGYLCGLSGKWHLGDSLHPQEGFDYWFTRPKGHTSTFYGAEAIWQGRVYREARYATEAITAHALDFLDEAAGAAASGAQPFFLFVGYNGPYGLGQHMTSTHVNAHTAGYARAPLTCFPRESVHPWLVDNRDLIGNPVSMRGYAAAVSGVDDGVGALLAALADKGLAQDTLVLFTADQGLCAGHHGMWGMGDHSRPIHTFEEAMHIPLILRHPACVPAGGVFEPHTCNYDVLPSLIEHLGLSVEVPAGHPARPGRSWAPQLRDPQASWDGGEAFFHELESVRTVRTARWKYSWRHGDGPDELYDMDADPGERWNLVHDPACADTVRDHRARIDAFFRRYADPGWDLWRGGGSKAGRLTL